MPVTVKAIRDILADNSEFAQWMKKIRDVGEDDEVKPSEEYIGLIQFESGNPELQPHTDSLLSMEEYDWTDTVRQYFVIEQDELQKVAAERVSGLEKFTQK